MKAAFSNNNITISAWLIFNDKGELINFISNDRYAVVENKMERLPWSTPLKDYREFGEYKLAGSAEVIYSYPQGDLAYGDFWLTNIEYNTEKFN